MLAPREALLLDGGDGDAIDQQCGCWIVEDGIDAQDAQGQLPR
jgi:hypothetical protein